MGLRVFRLGAAALLLFGGVMSVIPVAQAQDQASVAATANAAMQQMSNRLTAALAASSETAAKADVNAAISAGEEAVAALDTLRSTATDDVIRSRSEAASTQTSSAINKAKDALGRSGDAFRSGLEAARAEVNEAIEEFAPVLNLVGQATSTATSEATTQPVAAQQLPKTGEGDLTPAVLTAIGLLGAALLGVGSFLRRRYAAMA